MIYLAGITASGWYSIGLLFVGGEWRWNLSGSLTNESFINWKDGHPKDDMRFAYMDFNNDGQWVSVYGGITTQVLPFCEKSMTTMTKSTTKAVITTTTTTSTEHVLNITDSECLWPWVQILDSCYLMGWEASSRDDGRRFCVERGGYLMEVDSEEEQKSLTGNENFLISLNQSHCNAKI